ncbi:glycosyltransferase family 2 protein [Puniceibacterium sp. IMCC21224]|uniref:glycosyltransferase family 2 protein n=1 Tax=Puniceibacterium sp. IMCC21224 TaxID=1618204 RepID=UPI00064D94A9|nr:glycosyltransferase [Puniceibacterium sp. IMCC21224]KMK65531.1 putative glycosyltransferase [Puniceibacterium sp. IMCC21224]
MSTPPVSVIIVSRDRPDALDLCLTGVSQLDYPTYEVVVVACAAGVAQVQARADAALIKLVAFDDDNISVARNLGVAQAAGEVVAFLDDDAVPEPTWLRHLAAPFDSADVAAAGGYVRGRNGVSYQWQARTVDTRGDAVALALDGDAAQVLHPTKGRAIKTEGCNMALRREVLADLGGFDPALHFYLDETDLNMRLARAGYATAIVPLAQVHHGYAASPRRAADRTPRDLTQIGASLAVYLRKHATVADHPAAWQKFRNAQRQRLLRLMQRGPLGPDDVLRLLRGLDRGWREGQNRDIGRIVPLPRAAEGLRAYPGRPRARHMVLFGRPYGASALRTQAQSEATADKIVTLFLLSPTTLWHHVRFHPDGYWEHTGGQFGRSDRQSRWRRITSLRRRVDAEVARLAGLRVLPN